MPRRASLQPHPRLPRKLKYFLGPRGKRGRAARRGARHTNGYLYLLPDGLEGDPEGPERLCRNAFALADQPKEYVLGADEAVVEQASFFLSKDEHPPCPVGEAFEHILRVPGVSARALPQFAG